VEGQVPYRLLPATVQRDIHAAVAGPDDSLHPLRDSVFLFLSEVGIGIDLFFHLSWCQVVLIAQRLRLDVGRGNALFDQEVLRAGNTPFGERLVILRASTLVGMAFQSNLCIRLVLQIGLESEANSVRVFCWLGSRPPLGSCGLGLAVGK
jgi:hypothetical protein